MSNQISALISALLVFDGLLNLHLVKRGVAELACPSRHQGHTQRFPFGFAKRCKKRASQRCGELFAVGKLALANVAFERLGNGIKKLKVGGEPLLT